MFSECSSLTTLNLNRLNTNNVINMQNMFYQCFSLISLNLNNFNTSNVINMGHLFSNCKSLRSINLYNFDTQKVTNFNSMFFGCSSLLSINLSHFILEPNVDMELMFSSCLNLEYINLFNFNITSNMNSYKMFIYLVYCIKDDLLSSPYLQDLISKECSTNDCSDNWRKSLKKYINEKNKCVNNCSEDENYKFDFGNGCYKRCTKGTFRLSQNEFICAEYEEKEIEITELIGENTELINQSTEITGENTELISVENAEIISENTELISENDKLIVENTELIDEKVENDNKYCNENFPYLNKDDNKCVKNCDLSLISNYKCIKNIADKNIYESNFEYIINEINNSSDKDFLFNITSYNKEYIIKENNIIYQLTTTHNENINNNSNLSIVNLGICEDYLKEFCNIDKNLSLLLFKLEYYNPDYKIPLIEF